ncbi:hypothetical protein HALLA_00520 (plasmid) [Halostagnicola larsenii XH-48]|uniref:Uncharacterized protein n=1 Tax=Halostagnicola larsenii XH-48 TaxID=797299 RepID=W0JX09_9EURY|nr:hypothetical protein [Halostagnicola larsenii]AHG01807.1 hypothetical protein HALLA_00520 [Halostagnicola larsenii XH-48]
MVNNDSKSTVPPVARLAGAFGLGAGSGIGLAIVLAVQGDPNGGTGTAFALGALVFGVALLGWSAAVMGGRGFETMNEYLEGGSDWTEAGGRRAMVLLCSVGLGDMVGSSIVAAVIV